MVFRAGIPTEMLRFIKSENLFLSRFGDGSTEDLRQARNLTSCDELAAADHRSLKTEVGSEDNDSKAYRRWAFEARRPVSSSNGCSTKSVSFRGAALRL